LGALSEAEGRRDEPLVLCVARGAANKRLDHVVQAFEHFAQRFAPRARLALVGDLYADFDCGATLAERLRRSPVRERIEIPGSVSDRELADYYRRARLYVSMSEHEGFCIPPLEAFGCDVPVLAYQTPAVAETMGGAGILFTRKAWDEVAALMAELCFDETLRARVIAAQRERLTRPDITGARARLLQAVEGWLPAATAAPAHRRRRLVDRIGVVLPYDSVSEVASCTRGLAAAFRASGTPVTILAPSSESSWGPDPAHVLRIVSDRPAAYVSAAIEHGIRVVHQMVQPATGMHTVHTCRVITAFQGAGVPVYVTVHGPLFRGAPFLQPLIDSAPTFAGCAGVFVHDPADADVLRELGLNDVRTLSFGVPTLPSTDSAPLRAALGLGNRRVVAFVGSATTHGGLREAIQAMFLLHDRYPDVLLVAVPTAARDPGGWYLGECRDRIERLGLSSSIYLFDRPMSDAVAATLLQAADVVLVPASLDGFSTSLRWPLASRRAVVAPAWLGGERMRDAVHPLAAVTPQHLARGLDAILSDDTLRAARQAGAQRLAETHSWSQVAEEYLGGSNTPLRAAAG
jgi:glycosyltransferase involved in cell wall biosynthesis